jgi:sugar lactone lactonase YvrE
MYLNRVQSVDTDGRAELVVRVDRQPSGLACMLGGPDRRSLYDCTASTSYPDACRKRRDGRIEMLRVETPGAGLP